MVSLQLRWSKFFRLAPVERKAYGRERARACTELKLPLNRRVLCRYLLSLLAAWRFG